MIMIMILFDLASLPSLDGEGQVPELLRLSLAFSTTSNLIFECFHLKWLSLEIVRKVEVCLI